jgi:hypothetical protein
MRARVALLTVTLILLAGCSQVRQGSTGTVGGTAIDPLLTTRSTEQVTTLAVGALQDHWRTAFPRAFGRDWEDIRVLAPVHPADPAAPAPPCLQRAADVAGQAFYCPAADAVVWDADGLLPGLRDRFGPAGIVVVLAHEIGHAVQHRLGMDDAQRREPGRYPTILLESMADCFAGTALRRLADATDHSGPTGDDLADLPSAPPSGLHPSAPPSGLYRSAPPSGMGHCSRPSAGTRRPASPACWRRAGPRPAGARPGCWPAPAGPPARLPS